MGEKIRILREQIGITQKQLAQAIGVDASAVSFWESGKTQPTVANLVRIAEVLKCKPGDLFTV